MNRFIRWMRRVLQVEDLEQWCFDRECRRDLEIEGLRNDLMMAHRKLRSLSNQTLANSAAPRTELNELKTTVDFLSAESQELRTALAKAKPRKANAPRPQRPRR